LRDRQTKSKVSGGKVRIEWYVLVKPKPKVLALSLKLKTPALRNQSGLTRFPTRVELVVWSISRFLNEVLDEYSS
jgi:hypothetical protein